MSDTSGHFCSKILLVDDEPDGAEFAATLFGAHGLIVLIAHSAKEALQVLRDQKDIDAVLTDVMMPSMSGLELAKAIHQEYPRIKIVLVSGYAPPEQLNEKERAYLFAEKPYRIEHVLKLLRA
ncbi:response regulator [Massilia sp. Bi118]|uniref:response regulator n=1 Tax=Massilia sp. Bi118 TaxID=2822346 RepID=UPI001E2D1F69|nr:response regulator [Massilia sp. Bi118]